MCARYAHPPLCPPCVPAPLHHTHDQVTEHPECRMRVTVLESASGKDAAQGHKFKLSALLVLAGGSSELLAMGAGRLEKAAG